MSETEKVADLIYALLNDRRSRPEVFFKKVFLKDFAKFTEKRNASESLF